MHRSGVIAAKFAQFAASYGGAIANRSLTPDGWADHEAVDAVNDPGTYARGWLDSDGTSIVYCPVHLVLATQGCPLYGDGSMEAYLELIQAMWAIEINARRHGVDHAEAVDSAQIVLDDVEGVTAWMAELNAEAMDAVLGGPPAEAVGDADWALDLGLTDG